MTEFWVLAILFAGFFALGLAFGITIGVSR